MFGVKINEFDNSSGTIKDFNTIFPQTTLDKYCGQYVEIGGIIRTPFVRFISILDKNYNVLKTIEYDFGEGNFYENEDFNASENVRFKYIAKDLNNNIIAKAYSCQELSELLNCGIAVVKGRLTKTINKNTNTEHFFNVTRIEL